MIDSVAAAIYNPALLRKMGIEALTQALGPVGMTRFMQQFDTGAGNYTAERESLLAGITLDDFKRWKAETKAKRRQ
jgi:hypothetical protein